MSAVVVKTYDAPPVSKREALRYAGCVGAPSDVLSLLCECEAELLPMLKYKACYRVFSLKASGDELSFDGVSVTSRSLAKNLFGCERAVMFACSVGLGVDRMIERYAAVSTAKSVMMQALGAERVESLTEMLVSELGAAFPDCELKPRFSPGFGDLDIGFQRVLFAELDCARKIGVTLNDSMLMSPSKSVTAIVGLKKRQ